VSNDVPCLQFEFRRDGDRGYRGERVVPFERMEGHAPWEMLELRRGLPATKASGWWKGLLMRDRQDVRVARSRTIMGVSGMIDSHGEPSERLLAAWVPIMDQLRQAVDPAVFGCWLADLHPHRRLGGVWYVGCRPQACGWVEQRFGRLVAACADREVVFVACEQTGSR
jgi:hypothetical protein